MKDEKIKEVPSYSIPSNMVYVIGLLWKHNKILLAFLITLIPISLGISFCNIYLPKLVVSEVVNSKSINHMIILIILFGIIIAALNIINKTIETYMYAVTSKFNWAILLLTQKKALHTDYENIEASRYRLLMDRSKQLLWMNGYDSTLTSMSKNIFHLITNILGYFLFGTIISFASPWIAILLTVTALINYYIVKAIQEFQYRHRNDTSILEKKMWYIANSSGKFENAKEIRLYGMNMWFVNIYKSLKIEKMKWDKAFAKKYFISSIVDALIILLRDGFAYSVFIYMVLNGNVRIDEFILYFGAIGSFAGLVGGIFNGFIGINGTSLSVCDLRDYLNYIDKNKKSDGVTIENDNTHYEIELIRVKYRYEGADKDTLSDISIKIKSNEKIAIVGLNGAGKTTLIKNICGLYVPSSGNISINGYNKNEFDIYKYYSMFSVVFQDFNFLPVSIANTISSKTDGYTDRVKVIRCIQLAGLEEKINQLPNGIDSMLDKQLNENGIDFSGGEKQKLLLARAIYKDAPILILDEPTSALDPIAESELYHKYNELTKNKTSIYISHRLASTRFCDRILYMEDGRIVEDGNHDELMQMNGKYAYLFNIQSQYFKEGTIKNEGCKI